MIRDDATCSRASRSRREGNADVDLSRRGKDPVQDAEAAARGVRNFQAILQQTGANTRSTAALWSQVDSVLETLDSESGALLLLRYADAQRKRGRSDDVAEALLEIVQRYPQEPATVSALIWLLHHPSATALPLGVTPGRPTAAVGPFDRGSHDAAGDVSHAKAETSPPNGVGEAGVTTASLNRALDGASSNAERARLIAEQIRVLVPALYHEPEVRFPLAAALAPQSQSS